MSLRSSRNRGVLEIVHSDDRTANAFSVDEARELNETLDRNADVYGLIWTNQDSRNFCSGGNLNFYKAQKDQKINVMANRRIRKTLDRLSSLPFPTVVCVQGDAFGGGVELLSAFDYVLSVPHAFFGFWQRRQSLSFGWGGGLRLRRRLHRGEIAKLALSTRNISSYEALSLGLIDQIAPKGQILSKGRDWIEAQKDLSMDPVETIKSWSPSNERKNFEKLWLKKYE